MRKVWIDWIVLSADEFVHDAWNMNKIGSFWPLVQNVSKPSEQGYRPPPHLELGWPTPRLAANAKCKPSQLWEKWDEILQLVFIQNYLYFFQKITRWWDVFHKMTCSGQKSLCQRPWCFSHFAGIWFWRCISRLRTFSFLLFSWLNFVKLTIGS